MGNKATTAWLTKHLGNWHKSVPYDGLWLDMNEASNFCSGVQCKPDTTNETAMYCKFECWGARVLGMGFRCGCMCCMAGGAALGKDWHSLWQAV